MGYFRVYVLYYICVISNITKLISQQSGNLHTYSSIARGRSRTPAIFKMELFVTIFNSWKPSTTVTKMFILDVAGALYSLLIANLITMHTVY